MRLTHLNGVLRCFTPLTISLLAVPMEINYDTSQMRTRYCCRFIDTFYSMFLKHEARFSKQSVPHK